MFCGNCGTPMPDDMLFCPQCGAKNEELTKKQEKPSTGKKFPVGLFLGCLVLCLVLAAAGAGIDGSRILRLKDRRRTTHEKL